MLERVGATHATPTHTRTSGKNRARFTRAPHAPLQRANLTTCGRGQILRSSPSNEVMSGWAGASADAAPYPVPGPSTGTARRCPLAAWYSHERLPHPRNQTVAHPLHVLTVAEQLVAQCAFLQHGPPG